MNHQDPFDNSGDDALVKLIRQSELPIEFDSDELAATVLDRIQSRRRGYRNLAGTAAVLVVATTVGWLAIWSLAQQQGHQMVRNADNSPHIDNLIVEAGPPLQHPEQSTDTQQQSMNESTVKLYRLKNELARLIRTENEQQLALDREQLSRSIANNINKPFPVFIGD